MVLRCNAHATKEPLWAPNPNPNPRRAIEPCRGLWTVPAGFMELHESTAAGAARETWEEAHAHVEVGGGGGLGVELCVTAVPARVCAAEGGMGRGKRTRGGE